MGETKIIIVFFYLMLIVFFIGIVVFIIQYLKNKRIHQSEVKQAQTEIQIQTMKHIGREIHDSIGQKLTLASLYSQQLIVQNRVPNATDEVHNIIEIINTSITELRELSKSLTSNILTSSSLPSLIEKECDMIRQLGECEISFSNTLRGDVNSYAVKSILYRITQEFLQNSIKHAKCNTILISLSKSENVLSLELEDDGCGFILDQVNTNGIGLKNIEKRTHLIGGNFLLESSIGVGTQLIIKIPT